LFERGFKSWCERVAVTQRRELNLGPTARLDAGELAKHLRVLVWKANQVPDLEKKFLRRLVRDDADSWSAVTICYDGKDLVIVNPSHSEARLASDVMHELSHIIIGHEPARMDVSEDGLLVLSSYEKQQEEEAKWLSGCLLLPREALLSIRRRRIGLEQAAAEYGVSVAMLSFRLNVLKLAPARRAMAAKSYH